MRVFVGRPEPDAEKTADALRARGHLPFVAPLFAIEPRAPLPQGAGYDGVIVSSANALRVLPADSLRPFLALPLFAVGGSTAEIAREAGFASVLTGGGDAAALAQLVGSTVNAGSRLLRLAGAERQDEAFAALSPDIRIETTVTYASVAVERAPPRLVDALRDGALDAALHFSPRSARVFADLCGEAGWGDALSHLIHVCISDAAVDHRFQRVRVARTPDLSAMIDAL